MTPERRRRLLLAGGALVAVFAGWAGWRHFSGLAVDVVRVEPQGIRQSIVVSGRILSPARIDVGSVVTGRVAAVTVEEGARVEAGVPLVRLDTAELAASLAQAKGAEASAQSRVAQWQQVGRPSAGEAVRQAAANLAVAEKEAARARDLLARGFVGQARVDDAERAVIVARTQLDSARMVARSNQPDGAEAQQAFARLAEARAARELADARLANATILAPSGGVIILRSVEVGDVVQPGRRLLVLAVAGETRISAQVDEKNLALLAVGQAATVSADAFPDRRFAARVISISPGVDAQRGTVETKLVVPEPPAYLRSDMTVSVEIETAARSSALVIPVRALQGMGIAEPTVAVAVDGRAELRKVRIGVQGAGRVEVLSGLVAGDRVLIDATVPAGRRLRVVEVPLSTVAPPAAAAGKPVATNPMAPQ